jgi:hypothetical protein
VTNPYYLNTGGPAQNSDLLSQVVRDEFGLVKLGFDEIAEEIVEIKGSVGPSTSPVATIGITANYTTATTDNRRVLQVTSAVVAQLTIYLKDAQDVLTIPGYYVTIVNMSEVAHIIGRENATNTINGVAGNVVLLPKSAATFVVNSQNNGYLVREATGVGLMMYKAPFTGAKAFPLETKLSERISAWDADAFGNAIDITTRLQDAVNRAIAVRGVLEIPPAEIGSYYKVTAPIVFSGPVTIIGGGPVATTIMGWDMAADKYVFDFDLLAAGNVEWINISGIALRSNNGLPKALRLKNASFVHLTDVALYNVVDGIHIDGTRCFTHIYDNVAGYVIGGSTVKMLSTFGGGGHFTFNDATLTGQYGFHQESGAISDSIAFNDSNFEQCSLNSGVFFGTCGGLTIKGGRTEGCDGVDFNIRPTGASEYVNGLSISGVSFGASDAGAVQRISLGGNAGKVRGFSVTGNVVKHGTDSFAGALVFLNGDGESGVIAGNSLRGTNASGAVAVNVQRDGVIVFGNENLSGKLPEYWGLAKWGVAEGTFTFTDGSGDGLTLAASAAHYTKIGRQVFWQALVLYPATASSTPAALNGLPFNVLAGSGPQGRAGGTAFSDSGVALAIQQGTPDAAKVSFVNPASLAAITNAQLSGKTIYLSGQYAT